MLSNRISPNEFGQCKWAQEKFVYILEHAFYFSTTHRHFIIHIYDIVQHHRWCGFLSPTPWVGWATIWALHITGGFLLLWLTNPCRRPAREPTTPARRWDGESSCAAEKWSAAWGDRAELARLLPALVHCHCKRTPM